MGLHERLLRLKKTRGRPPSINMCEYTMLRMILKCEMQSWHAVDYCTIKPLGGGGGKRFPKPKPMRNNLLRQWVVCPERCSLVVVFKNMWCVVVSSGAAAQGFIVGTRALA